MRSGDWSPFQEIDCPVRESSIKRCPLRLLQDRCRHKKFEGAAHRETFGSAILDSSTVSGVERSDSKATANALLNSRNLLGERQLAVDSSAEHQTQ
jgi:hypothetical protein